MSLATDSHSWLASPTNWALVTASAAAIAYGFVQPDSCDTVPQCASKHDAISANFNTYAAYGLVMVLIGEVANLLSTYQGAKEAQAMISDLRSRCLPSLLLVLSFLVLICESSVFAGSREAWFATNRPDFDSPVFTVTFVEWLIIVPMLLVMAGHCALGRPLQELGRPIVVTNVYIIMSWVALITTNAALRWSLVAATFAMYAWASLDMALWVVKYLSTAPAELSSRLLRPCLSLGLIALFAVYAVVYMAVLFGVMEPRTERMTFLFLNVGSKLAFSVSFVVIRGNEYHSTLTGVLKKLSTSNLAVVSILRGSFDVLLPCTSDMKGGCRLPNVATGDMAQLEHALQRPVAGKYISELLADDEERRRFAAYVKNSQRQALVPKAIGSEDWGFSMSGGELPPIAQVLHCNFLGREKVACAVHLSVVPSVKNAGSRMVAAVRFMEEKKEEEEAAAFAEFEELKVARTDTASTGETKSEKSADARMVASLLDVARMGMSALLHTAQSSSGGEVESGYESSEASFVKPQEVRSESQGTQSGVQRRASSSSSGGLEEPLEVRYEANTRTKQTPSVASSGDEAFQRLTTLLEPEEEYFSRSTTEEQKESPVAAVEMRRSQAAAETRRSPSKALKNIGDAVAAAAQELVGIADKKGQGDSVGIYPLQLNLAVGTIALAATFTMFSMCRR